MRRNLPHPTCLTLPASPYLPHPTCPTLTPCLAPNSDPVPNPTPTPNPTPNQVLRNVQYVTAERNHKERLATPPLQRFFSRLRRSADEAADAVFGSGGLQLSTNSSLP